MALSSFYECFFFQTLDKSNSWYLELYFQSLASSRYCTSTVDSPDCIKTKKQQKNAVNDYDKCFQYTATVALSH